MVDTKKIERCAYLKKAIVAKIPIYSTELVAVIFVHESICNHSILIWQFHNSNCSYLISIVNFLKEQFALAEVTLGTVAFSKDIIFRSTYSLNFLSGYCSFQEQLLLAGSVPAVLCLFPRKVGLSYAYFRKYYNYLYRILAAIHSFTVWYIFLTLKFAAIQFYQRTSFSVPLMLF